MDLREFVQTVLVQIVEGVVAAQTATSERNALINPVLWSRFSDTNLSTFDGVMIRDVEFDVAIYASENSGGAAGASVALSVVSMRVGGERSQSEGSSSRVKFAVPIALPARRQE